MNLLDPIMSSQLRNSPLGHRMSNNANNDKNVEECTSLFNSHNMKNSIWGYKRTFLVSTESGTNNFLGDDILLETVSQKVNDALI